MAVRSPYVWFFIMSKVLILGGVDLVLEFERRYKFLTKYTFLFKQPAYKHLTCVM